ncbi:unnamed protein product [Arabidopsis lyrata]|uniref:F-box domain-containing protein n=1 Tax=Arabidopsis lyrata subsp. lyrata TaxID=81972 RepID=D7LSI7_ARALL|nr:hypothetical protein ARALYDRAFT_323527 [Arabidopsis lyrata subsp. lyrata]CAH8268007.1 unnamed protein product [Arabidopsis lyrata]
MEKRQKLVSEKDPLTISRNSIPIDLFISILSRLPVKSIARCRCVSKQWASILRRPDFTDLFLKVSSTRPCLLFTFNLNGKWLFFSAPQHQNSCILLAADRHMSFSTENVLSLGTGELSWRTIECSISHCSASDGICINGVVYYLAACNGTRLHTPIKLVCFDVRFEKFKFLDVNSMIWMSTLVNFNGKLGAILPDELTESIELRVLEDPEEGKWSRHIYIFPPIWKNLVAQEYFLCVVGMTHSGEIVFSSYFPSDPFYVLRYNVERNTIIKVEIQRLGSRKGSEIFTFIDHVENVKHI